MKDEFKKLIPIWGISKKEVEKISDAFSSEEEFKQALIKKDIEFLSEKDEQKLIKFYSMEHKSKDEKICGGCGNKISKKLDRNICLFCGIKN